MSTPRDASVAAELTKLAHLLGKTPPDLRFLDAVPAGDLRLLRRQAGQALFEADRSAFEKVATLARLLPAALAAKVAELALAPLVAARVAEVLDPGKAADLVARLPDAYLADVAAVMDPSRAPAVVAALPPGRVGTVARELVRRSEWVVIGAFLSHVSAEGLRAAAAVFDGEQLLRIGFVLDDRNRLQEVTELLRDAQIDAVLTAAATDALWTELDVVVTSVSAGGAARYAERFAAARAIVRAAVEQAVAAGRLSMAAGARLGAKRGQ